MEIEFGIVDQSDEFGSAVFDLPLRVWVFGRLQFVARGIDPVFAHAVKGDSGPLDAPLVGVVVTRQTCRIPKVRIHLVGALLDPRILGPEVGIE